LPQTETGHARDYAAVALQYAKTAAADRYQRTHNKFVRLAAQRHLDDLKRSRRRDFGFKFSAEHANDVCDFIEKLPHVEGVWKHPNIILEPFQIFVLACVFGWRRKDNGYRRFTVVYEEVARKNAKSTKTAGIGLYCLTCEGDVGPQILTAATTYDQAKKVFYPAKRMVEKTPDLQEAFGVTAWAKSITCADNGGYMQPIHAKSKTQDGHNPKLVTLDELHAHDDRGLYDVMRSSQGQQINPLFWQISTAGFNLEGICFEQRAFAIKVLQREIVADHVFAIIFTLDRGIDYAPPRKVDDNPYDEKNWIKANPLLASAESQAMWIYLRNRATEAEAGSEGDFLTKNMNQWLGAAQAWLNSKRWAEKADPGLRLKHFKGLDCYIGADLSDKDDITALHLAALDPNNRLLLKSWFFVPEAALERTSQADRENVELYKKWKARRKLIVTPGDMVDQRIVKRKIKRIFKAVCGKKITFDQWGSQIIASDLNEDLSSPDEPVAFIMNKTAANVTPAAKEIEARVRAKGALLVHDDNPVMNWMVGNAVVDRRVNGSLLPKKPKAMSRQKIDGVDSMLNAVAPIVIPTVVEPPSMYETQGIAVI
jgi:phage terminase large subunit-like protein